jgi:hypothetical protein
MRISGLFLLSIILLHIACKKDSARLEPLPKPSSGKEDAQIIPGEFNEVYKSNLNMQQMKFLFFTQRIQQLMA